MLQNIDLIQTREYLLSRFLGISPRDAFNTGQDAYPTNDGITIVTGLKQAINNIEAQAITSNGKTVEYSALAGSKIYQEYRTELTPQLRYFDPTILKTNTEQLAFWINLFNVLVIDGVIRLWVQSSVTEGFAGIVRFFHKRLTISGDTDRFGGAQLYRPGNQHRS